MAIEPRHHAALHALLLAAVALLSWWGEGAAFLVLYAALLGVGALALGLVLGIGFVRTRTSGAAPPRRATRWVLNGLLAVLCAALSIGGIVGLLASRSEPIGSFPGGRLAGEPADHTPASWSFLDEFEMVQLEVSPDAPRSINVHSFVIDGQLFVGADFYFPFKRWVHVVARDDRVVVRARGKLYPLRAVRIEDSNEVAAIRTDLERRLALWRGLDPESTPGFQTEVWIFRLDPR